jgi:polysaccharide pyruvyl transferase WcaK-like protein
MINGKRLILIRGVGFVNKGAELMLYAILEKMKQNYPSAKFALETNRSASYEKRALLGLYQKPRFFRFGLQFGRIFEYFPSVIRRTLGLVVDKDIDVVIDASGLSYSDHWGPRSAHELSKSCKRWKKNGTKVILMPQAFGPFKNKKIRKYLRTVIKNSDLIFARERISYEYLANIVGDHKNIKIGPDFTNLLEGVVPEEFDSASNRFCIVPNYRMIDKTNSSTSEAYLPFMINVTQIAFNNDLKPFILVHEGEDDLILAKKIQNAVDSSINIIKEEDPLKIKGILGLSSAVVSSRFHGLVSSLSQGVPSLATSWSHKYEMLFKDYDFPEGALDITLSKEQLYENMDWIINQNKKSELTNKLQKSSQKIKLESIEMWSKVFSIIDNDL